MRILFSFTSIRMKSQLSKVISQSEHVFYDLLQYVNVPMKTETSRMPRYGPLHRWRVIFLLNQKFINHVLRGNSHLVTDASETLTASTTRYSSDKAVSAGNLVALLLLKWQLTTPIWFTVNTLIRKSSR